MSALVLVAQRPCRKPYVDIPEQDDQRLRLNMTAKTEVVNSKPVYNIDSVWRMYFISRPG